MRVALVLVMAAACTGGMTSERSRWPDHRKHSEARITELEKKVEELSARLAALEGHPVAPAAATPPPPPPPPAPPAPMAQAIDREMIAATIQPLVPAIRACGDHIPTKGTVKVSVKVDPDGHVASAAILEAPDKLMGECVGNVISGATFPRTATGGQFSYPFVF